MSELIEKLKIAARLEVPPLGFAGVSKARVKPKPVIVAAVAGDEKQAISLVKGADAVFIETYQEEVADRLIKQLEKENNEMPYGCWLGNNAACENDFYAFKLDAYMSLFKETKVGKALVVDPEIEDKYLRQIDDLPVDAIVIQGQGKQACQLTIKNYILCRRIAYAVKKPLLVRVELKITAKDIEEMWNYGIDGFVVEVDPVFPSAVEELREVIDGLDLDSRRKKATLSPVIPSMANGVNDVQEPLPDDDDDDYDE